MKSLWHADVLKSNLKQSVTRQKVGVYPVRHDIYIPSTTCASGEHTEKQRCVPSINIIPTGISTHIGAHAAEVQLLKLYIQRIQIPSDQSFKMYLPLICIKDMMRKPNMSL